MKMKTLLILVALLTFIAAAPSFAQQPVKTEVWSSFAGFATTINGFPIPVGSIIAAYDPNGVLCGMDTTGTYGQYGALDVYGDDSFTPQDEGCVSGDTIHFTINGIPANPFGGDDTWTGYGPYKILNLASVQNFSVAISGPDGSIGLLDSIVTYHVTITNNGSGIDLVGLGVSSMSGWQVSGAIPFGSYFAPAQVKGFNVTVHVPSSAVIGYQDTLVVTATSLFDNTATGNKKIVTTADNTTGVNDGGSSLPSAFTLDQNFPNPFNPETMISFNLDKSADVSLVIFDILGRKVATVCQGVLSAGSHQYRWTGVDDNGIHVSSGVYFYRLSSDQGSITRKMAYIK